LPANWAFPPPRVRARYPSIRADCGGFSEPFPNGAPMAGPPAYRAEGPRFDPSTRHRPLGEAMDLERGSSTVVRAYVRPPRRRSGDRSMSDLGLDLSALALALGLKLAGAEAITTYREDGQTADGAAPSPLRSSARAPCGATPCATRSSRCCRAARRTGSRRFNEAADRTRTHDLCKQS
jgi:hypothetical protein